jgi:DNA polymerase III subunit beta
MKIVCDGEKLKKAVTHAEKVTGKNLTLPILSNILLLTGDKELIIRATNLNLGIEIRIPAVVEEEGVVAVSGQTLSSLFSTSKEYGKINLFISENSLIVKTDKGKTTLKTYPSDDFPTIPQVQAESIKIQNNIFVEGIKSVYYSAAQSDIKPEVSSVYIYQNDNSLFFVATDSFRLAEKKIKNVDLYGFTSTLIPYKNIQELLRIIDGEDVKIILKISKNQISIEFDGYYITSRVVDGTFPDYKQIIPQKYSTNIIVLKQDLLQALKTTTIFSDKFNQVTLDIDGKNKKCILGSKNNDIGEHEYMLDGAITGLDASVSFNHRYLLDALQAINSDSVSLEINDGSKPVIIRGVSDDSFMYLIMPMNK